MTDELIYPFNDPDMFTIVWMIFGGILSVFVSLLLGFTLENFGVSNSLITLIVGVFFLISLVFNLFLVLLAAIGIVSLYDLKGFD